MILLLDNFDSFTYNLLDYFGQLGLDCKVVRNDVPVEEIAKLDFDAIVLSPGPGRPADAGNLMQVIDRYHKRVPMLGVCLGHQALGEYFGAQLQKGLKPMHGKLSEVVCTADAWFENIPSNFNVVRYHSLVLHDLPDCLLPIAYTKPGNEIMLMRHRDLPVFGVQYHPEAHLTSHGLTLLHNWAKLCGLRVIANSRELT